MNIEDSMGESEIKSTAKIRVIGVGGAGCNAVEYMKLGHRHKARVDEAAEAPEELEGVDYWVCNTDYKHIEAIPIENKIQLGPKLTKGLGAGCKPEVGKDCALESMEDIKKMLDGADMVFVTAGMGGGTGTGAAPVIARTAKDMNILTVGVVSIPYLDERGEKLKIAYEGVKAMVESVDSLIVLNSECLKALYGSLGLSKAFAKSDQVLSAAVRGISEIIAKQGAMNVDFADIRTFMTDSGVAFIGTGVASGENRAMEAVRQALSSPIINNRDIKGSKNVIIFFQSDEESEYEVTQDELSGVLEYINELIDIASNAGMGKLKFGSVHDASLGSSLKVTIVATGFQESVLEPNAQKKPEVKTLVQYEDQLEEERGFDDEPTVEFEISSSTQEILDKLYKQTTSSVEDDNKYSISQLKEITCFPLVELEKEDVISKLENESAVSRWQK